MTDKKHVLESVKLKAAFPLENYLDKYHLKEIQMNLFYEPYKNIDSRANSINSSAAMIYNTIGPDKIILDGITFDTIEYERPFEVRNEVSGYEPPNPAQLDVSLLSKDGKELILVESKFLEWFYAPKSCNKAYLSKRCYREETGSYVNLFIDSFRHLLTNPQIEDSEHKGCILPFYKRYDAIQMTIHILGIYNWCVHNKKSLPPKITLMNIVWDCESAEEYLQEEKEGKEYEGFANLTFRNVFEALGVSFKVEYVKYSDFLKRIDWSKDMEHRNYLKRYEI